MNKISMLQSLFTRKDNNSYNAKNVILSILFVFFWASGFSFAKLGLESAGPFTLLFLRYTFASLLFLPFLFIFKPSLPKSLINWVRIILVGVAIQVVFFSLVYHAIVSGVTAVQ